MKKLMFVLMAVLCLSGCSDSAKSLTCKVESEVMKVSNTYTYEDKEDGKLLSQTSETEVNLESASADKDKIYEALEKVKEAYDGVEGIEYSYKEENNTIYETTKIDFTKIDPANLLSLKIEANGQDVFNAEQFKQDMTDTGFTCE